MRSSLGLGFAAVMLSLVMIPQAGASLLVEPYLGYHVGNETIGSPSTSVALNGVTFGGRVGFQKLGFMAGGDLMTGSWNQAGTSTMASSTGTPTDLGVFAGYNFPVLIRVYGVYGLSSQFKSTQAGVNSTTSGTDMKLGVGFTMFPLISINLEYITGTYTKTNAGPITPNTTTSLFGVTVSVPLTFF